MADNSEKYIADMGRDRTQTLLYKLVQMTKNDDETRKNADRFLIDLINIASESMPNRLENQTKRMNENGLCGCSSLIEKLYCNYREYSHHLVYNAMFELFTGVSIYNFVCMCMSVIKDGVPLEERLAKFDYRDEFIDSLKI